MRILQVADRPGWAIDRLSKPLSEIYDNVDMSYFCTSADRYLDSGYSDWKTSVKYTNELGNQYDVIHFHRVEAAVPFLSGLKPSIKKVITLHTERHDDYDDKRIMLFNDVICPTKHSYDRLQYNLKTWCDHKVNIHQIAYGIDLDKYKQEETEAHYLPHAINLDKYHKTSYKRKDNEVGYVGRIVPWKRYDIIQKAVHDAGLKLIACGYIGQSSLMKKNNLSEGKDYTFTSFLPEPLMASFYSRMHLFICLSIPHVEAGPLPILEAMACKVPVITTRIGWAIDHCEHLKNIYFIEEDEIGQLSNVIRMLYNDKTLQENLASHAYELIQNFSIKKYAEDLMKIYVINSWS